MENICAIATPYGKGAISIIRCSGKDTIKLVNKIFKGKDLEKVPGNRIVYGHIVYENEVYDEVMVSIFKAPHSFDGENSCEINCHGGVFVTHEILKLLLKIGFRMAEPGEFSKRAFLNHKMDLTEAESIMDIVEAENKLALKSSLNALSSKLKVTIEDLRNKILDLLAKIEVNIDYPEYDDTVDVDINYLMPHLEELIQKMAKILDNSKISKVVIKGVKTAIVGRPNVGKSSLLNMLLDEDKAIVSNIAGTTRDIVEGSINLGEVTLHLLDTAGIRESLDVIENIGVMKSKKVIEEADLVLLVLDSSKPLQKEDYELIELVNKKKHLIIANKKDLDPIWNLENIIYISALNKEGMEELKEAIYKLLALNEFNEYDPTLNNTRQYDLMTKAYTALQNALASAKALMDVSLIEIDLKEAFDKLGEITGESYPEELITALFTKFCLGK